MRGYHRDEGLPRCAIKIDLMEAYDYVDWGFTLIFWMPWDFSVFFSVDLTVSIISLFILNVLLWICVIRPLQMIYTS